MVRGQTAQGHRQERRDVRSEAELRGKVTTAQPQRYYYDRLREVQSLAYSYQTLHGRRPPEIAVLYLAHLEDEQLKEQEAAAREWAGFFAHFDIEPSSSLVLVRTEQDYAATAEALLDAWRRARSAGVSNG